MQKGRLGFIGLALGMILFSQTAMAACDGGTEFTGKNGKTFCVSDVNMNWWSAFTWCESQGMQLASMSDLCDVSDDEHWFGQGGEGACPGVIGYGPNKEGWTSLVRNQNDAYHVQLSTGRVQGGGGQHTRTYTYPAVCL